ncbi:hypothetical protein [Amycolatopsis circi]|uniref:hypothetical protein n=1 Tax=Amycolatopsis circi TaxID=871959 RepID=UPI0013BE9A60|nr:hypothetical protein [Amycolatopsis circi]
MERHKQETLDGLKGAVADVQVEATRYDNGTALLVVDGTCHLNGIESPGGLGVSCGVLAASFDQCIDDFGFVFGKPNVDEKDLPAFYLKVYCKYSPGQCGYALTVQPSRYEGKIFPGLENGPVLGGGGFGRLGRLGKLGEIAGKNIVPESGKFGKTLQSMEDVFANPQLLRGKLPDEVEKVLKETPGWRIETLGKGSHQGEGWVMRKYNERGNPTGPQLRWHPGGGHHGPEPYWRVVGPNGDLGGIIR